MKDFLRISKSMFELFMRHKRGLYIYLILLAVSTLLGNFVPFFYKAIVDYVTTHTIIDFKFLLILVLGIGVFKFLAGAIFELTFYVFDNGFFIRTLSEIQLKVFSHIQRLDFYYHQNKKSGTLISAMSKGQNAFDSYTFNILFNFTSFIITLLFVLITFSFINVEIMLVVFVTIIAFLVATKLLISENIARRNIFNKADDELKGIIADNLVNYDSVKFYRQEGFEINRLTEKAIDWRKWLANYVASYRTIGLIFSFITAFGMALALIIAISDVANKSISIGTFVLIVTFITTLFQQLSALFYELREIAKNFSDLKAYFDILENKEEVLDPTTPVDISKIEGNVEFKDITFAYTGRKPVLTNINFSVSPGQTAALVGRSGAGKTTISKLLLRLYDVTKGEVLIDGENIKNFKQDDLKYLVGIVPQEPMLFNESIRYNIAYANPDVSLKKVKDAAKLAFLDEFIATLPQKYNTEVGERGIKLSGGQKQRLAIARTIIQNPKIIIFDEATSHLDSESERYIQQALEDISKDKTVIIIAHRLSTIMHADKILVFEDGKLVDEGTHSELLENNSVLYKKLWDLQSKGEL